MSEHDGPGLGFLLTRSTEVDVERLVTAARDLGVGLVLVPSDKDGIHAFDVEGGGHLFVMPLAVAHPDARGMLMLPLSPDAAALDRAQAHVIVTAMGLPGSLVAKDATMARLIAATVQGTEAEGAMMGHGILFYKAPLFSGMVGNARPGELPVEICVDLTMGPEPDGRFGFLTHGLQRYGREEFFVTTTGDKNAALDFTWMMARWMIMEPDKHLPTGDTLGRSAEEKILVQRVPSPSGEGPDVIRLDLD